MNDTNAGVYEQEMYIEANPETVFAFFTDPDKMVRWMGVSATLEPKEGGLYLVDVTNGNIAKGEFREVLPNYRLSYTFGWESEDSGVPPGSSLVEIDLTPKEPGTMMKFTHSGLPEAAVKPHSDGWDHYCERLCLCAAGKDPGPDSWVKSSAAD